MRGILTKSKEIFLCQHKNKEYWCLPGGHLEKGETLKECLVREFKEEFNVNIIVGDMLYIREMLNDYDQRIEFYFLVECTEELINKIDNELKICNEIQDTSFFSYKLIKRQKLNIKPDILSLIFKNINHKRKHKLRYLGKVD